jgi:hypothetical protein
LGGERVCDVLFDGVAELLDEVFADRMRVTSLITTGSCRIERRRWKYFPAWV